MPLLTAILEFVQANPYISFVIAAFILMKFGLIDAKTVLDFLNVIKRPEPAPSPAPVPADPAPAPLDLRRLIEQLIPLLLKAKAEGDTETETAILRVMGQCPHCHK